MAHFDAGGLELARNDALCAHARNGIDFDEHGVGSVGGQNEVGAHKRGSGPQGRGGKTITRERESSSSESLELESEEDDEGLDGLYGIMRTKTATREELLALLREKERTIKKLQSEVHS